jgi:hypothetical protein
VAIRVERTPRLEEMFDIVAIDNQLLAHAKLSVREMAAISVGRKRPVIFKWGRRMNEQSPGGTPAAPRHPSAGAPNTMAYGQACLYDDCKLEAWCGYCGGVCLLHCAGRTSRWEALKYFFRAWRAYVAARF